MQKNFFLAIPAILLLLTACGRKPSAADCHRGQADEYVRNFREVQPDYEGQDAVFFMIQFEDFDDRDSLLERQLYCGYLHVEHTADTAYYWHNGDELTLSDSLPVGTVLPDGRTAWSYLPTDTAVLLNEYGDVVEKADAIACTGYYVVFDGRRYYVARDGSGYAADCWLGLGNGGFRRHVTLTADPALSE